MISTFLQLQMDYILFFYGLCFILLAATTWALSSGVEPQIPWKWLCLFGFLHGINEWLDMLAYSLKDNSAFSVVRLIVMAISFLFLIEFGRSGLKTVHGKTIGLWIFLPLLLLAGCGAIVGISELNAGVRYALGFTGALWTALALWRYRQTAHPGSRHSLLIAALSMGFYGLAAGLVVPQAPFFPASVLNHASFFAWTGFPVQLLRGTLACTAAVAVWRHYCMSRRSAFKAVISPADFRNEGWALAGFAILLAAGWIMTSWLGELGRNRDEQHYRSELELARSAFATSVMTADDLVKTMAASPSLIAIGLQSNRDLAAINSTLDRYATVIQGSICYVLDAGGTTLASSNRDTPESFVGHSYAIRPYFKEAMQGLQGRHVAIGLTTNIPGYYATHPIRDASGIFAGVAVVKINLDRVFMAPISGNFGFLVDSSGVILASTQPGFFLQTLHPIPEEIRRQISLTKQFPSLSDVSVLPAAPLPGTLFTYNSEVVQIFEQPTSIDGLTFVLLGSMSSWKMTRLVAIFITMLVAVLLLVFFVTQQKNTESSARIASSEKLYRTLVEGSPDWIGLFDHNGRCIAVNGNGLEAMGRTEAEVLGRRFSEIWSKEAGTHFEELASKVLQGERVWLEADQSRPDGSSMTWHTVLNPIIEKDRAVSAFVAMATDITARKQAEDMLARANRQNEMLLNSAGDGIYGVDMEGRTIFCNPMAIHLVGYRPEEMIGRRQHDLIHHTRADGSVYLREECPIYAAFKDGQVHHVDTEVFWRKDGTSFPVAYTSTPMYDRNGELEGAVVVFKDITEHLRNEEKRNQLEKRVQQVEKAESLGLMAGAIAHHFNNQLTVVTGYLEMVLDDLPGESNLRENIVESMKASRRAAEMSRLMLSYLGQTTGQMEPLMLVPTIQEALPLLSATMPERAHLKAELPDQGPAILGDPVHIKQILTNLISNASEALEEKEGDITVGVRVVAASEILQLRLFPPDWEPEAASYACISIADTGSGMNTATLEKIFDPFFSTKFIGRGLGLPVVLGLVRAHDGAIAIESHPGLGSVFQVFLPVHDQASTFKG